MLLHRSKRSSRLMAISMLALALLTGTLAVTTLLSPAPLAVALAMIGSCAVFLGCGLLLSVIRVTVTSEDVAVQFGLWGPRVALEAIESCRVVAYDWKRFGGWGIKRAWDGTWAYTLSPSAPVVELRWRDGDTTRAAVFNASDPEAVVAAIQRGREARGGARFAVEGDVAAEQAPIEERSRHRSA
jgi:hypothetical protein